MVVVNIKPDVSTHHLKCLTVRAGDDYRLAASRYGRKGVRWLAGVDEAGRGPLAGPVVAAACLVPVAMELEGVRDSKLLSKSVRKRLFWSIIARSMVGIGFVGEQEIDRMNILQASLLAMRKAILQLAKTPDLLLIDGPFRVDLPIDQLPVIRGDQTFFSVAAASIVAKVTRDAFMEALDQKFPQYGFREHKGYPTPEHLAFLKECGPSPVHRLSFRPVMEAVTRSAVDV